MCVRARCVFMHSFFVIHMHIHLHIHSYAHVHTYAYMYTYTHTGLHHVCTYKHALVTDIHT